MTPSPELSPLLKRLRLSGILDSLDRRNREAIENKLPYTVRFTMVKIVPICESASTRSYGAERPEFAARIAVSSIAADRVERGCVVWRLPRSERCKEGVQGRRSAQRVVPHHPPRRILIRVGVWRKRNGRWQLNDRGSENRRLPFK
jgi:hypothetical protein